MTGNDSLVINQIQTLSDYKENYKKFLEFSKNKTIMLCAATKATWVVYYLMDESIKQNKDLMIQLVDLNPAVFEFLPLNLRNDPEIVLSAYLNKPSILDFASERIQFECRRRNPEEVLSKMM